jgi:hypothetical protein
MIIAAMSLGRKWRDALNKFDALDIRQLLEVLKEVIFF